MNRRGRLLVEHDGITYELRWETQEKESVITVEYTFNGESGYMNRELPHEGVAREALYQWITSMVLCDMTEHYKELENADTATEGFPDVEPISALAKPQNDVNQVHIPRAQTIVVYVDMSINTSRNSHFIGGRWIYRHPSWCMVKCPVCDVWYRGYGWYDKVCYKCFDEDEKFNADMSKAIAIIGKNRDK